MRASGKERFRTMCGFRKVSCCLCSRGPNFGATSTNFCSSRCKRLLAACITGHAISRLAFTRASRRHPSRSVRRTHLHSLTQAERRSTARKYEGRTHTARTYRTNTTVHTAPTRTVTECTLGTDGKGGGSSYVTAHLLIETRALLGAHPHARLRRSPQAIVLTFTQLARARVQPLARLQRRYSQSDTTS